MSSEYEVLFFGQVIAERKILDMLSIATIKGSKGEVNITFPIICIAKVNFDTTFQDSVERPRSIITIPVDFQIRDLTHVFNNDRD